MTVKLNNFGLSILRRIKPETTPSSAGVLLALLMLELGWGVWGLIVSPLISQMAYNTWHWTIAAHREMEMGLGDTVRYGWAEMKKIVNGFLPGKRIQGS